jgi:hypothetical protein
VIVVESDRKIRIELARRTRTTAQQVTPDRVAEWGQLRSDIWRIAKLQTGLPHPVMGQYRTPDDISDYPALARALREVAPLV